MEKISVVVPCYNEEKVIPAFYREICKVISSMQEKYAVNFEIIFVDDGSRDKTADIIKEISQKDPRFFYISFSRNFGKEAAICAGIRNITGDYAVIMDSDLQDPPALLPEMYERIRSGDCDSVATARSTRKNEPPIRSFFARLFYKLFNKLCRLDVMDGARDYRMMNRKMSDSIAALTEHSRFSKGIYSWVGFKTQWIMYENIERAAGETKWSFWGLFRYAMSGFFAYTPFPSKLSFIPGFLFVALSLCCAIFAVFAKANCGTYALILFVSGLILISLGFLGKYIYAVTEESKNRPLYIIRSTNIGEK